jgi:hypothetical protein
MSTSLNIDPASRDLTQDDDDQIVFTDDPSPELLCAIAIRLNSFHGDPDQGSLIPGFTEDGIPPTDAAAEVEAAAETALVRLEQSGLITVRDVTYSPTERTLDIEVDELGEPFTLVASE